MDTPSRSLLDDELSVLINHFGIDRVRTALDKIGGQTAESRTNSGPEPARPRQPARTGVVKMIASLRDNDPQRHDLLHPFATQLADRSVLPEADDIRQFSQLVGMKAMSGKSRRDLVPELLAFLIESPIEQLRSALPAAEKISSKQRQQGFGILTDKLLERHPQNNRPKQSSGQ
jgi:hypothetical protein